MGNSLPKNWVETEVKQISSIIRGVSYKNGDAFSQPFENSCLVLRGGNIQDGKIIVDTDNVYVSLELVDQKQLLQTNDVVIVGSTGSSKLIGKAAHSLVSSNDIAFGAFLMLLRATDKINSRYFSYFFQTSYYRKAIQDLAAGVNINNIRKEHIDGLIFPLPPLAEQQRIVAKLDALFGQLDTIKKSLENVPVLLKNFRQQVLTQAVTGKLTEEWREGKELEEWTNEKANSCCEKVQSGGTPKGSTFELSGIPFLKVYNIVNNKIDFESKPQYVSEEIQNSQIKKSIIFPGDVIMNIVGPPLNKVAIIPEDYKEWNINQAITLFRTKEYLVNKFLYYFFCEGQSVKSLVNETKGVVGQVNISLSQCRDFDIPIPPLEEQQEIVRRVESLFAKADVIEAQYNTLKEKVDKLPQAILQKAFKGELTQQLDTDGDARELLKAIEQLKNTNTKPKKNRAYAITTDLKMVAEPE